TGRGRESRNGHVRRGHFGRVRGSVVGICDVRHGDIAAGRCHTQSCRRSDSSWMWSATSLSLSACSRPWWAQNSSSPPPGMETRMDAWAPQRSQRSAAESGGATAAVTWSSLSVDSSYVPIWTTSNQVRGVPASTARTHHPIRSRPERSAAQAVSSDRTPGQGSLRPACALLIVGTQGYAEGGPRGYRIIAPSCDAPRTIRDHRRGG